MWTPNVKHFACRCVFLHICPISHEILTSDVGRRFAPGQLVLITAMRGRLWRALYWRRYIALNGGDALILKGKLEVTRGIGPRSRGRTAYEVLVYLRECERIRVTQFLEIYIALFSGNWSLAVISRHVSLQVSSQTANENSPIISSLIKFFRILCISEPRVEGKKGTTVFQTLIRNFNGASTEGKEVGCYLVRSEFLSVACCSWKIVSGSHLRHQNRIVRLGLLDRFHEALPTR